MPSSDPNYLIRGFDSTLTGERWEIDRRRVSSIGLGLNILGVGRSPHRSSLPSGIVKAGAVGLV